MKSLMSLLQYVLKDLGTWCCASTDRDLKTITVRVEHEGLSFLTITLADFGKELQKALDQGHVGPNQFASFSRAGGLPRFLGGFLDQVFDRSDGRLLEDPSVTCIWALRQFTLMWSKIFLPCTSVREKGAIERYLQNEEDVRETDRRMETAPELVADFARLGRLLWADIFAAVDQKVHDLEVRPKHGPGATADKLSGNAKWNQLEWTERLEQVFPHGEYLASSWRLFDRLADVRILEPGAERPVRVVPVPKTQRTPRIIAEEPTCMQYMQQALLGELECAVEADYLARHLVGWTDQVPNQHLAEQGSKDRATATLDLSDASDRVSYQHVRVLLRNHPWLFAAVDSTRSRKADVPRHDGMKTVRLAKFASMGSALCFPIEAMVFCTVVFLGIERELKRQLTKKDVRSLLGKVRLFGDDIIVPTEYALAVTTALEDFGLRVNRDKSFWTGKFRESCGKEYFDGHDVSIVKIRRFLPTNRKQVPEIVGTFELRNQLYFAGMWQSAGFLDRLLGDLKIPLPRVGTHSPVLGRHSFLGYETQRLCKSLHIPQVKGYVVTSRSPKSHLDDYGALLKCLVSDREKPIPDPRHLERAGRPFAVDIKRRWGSAI